MPRSSTKSPSYIVRQNHSYCFRYVIPAPLRSRIGRTELRYTLHTGSLCVAKQRAKTIGIFVSEMIRVFKEHPEGAKACTREEFTRQLNEFIVEFRKTWDLDFIRRTLLDNQWRRMLKSIVSKNFTLYSNSYDDKQCVKRKSTFTAVLEEYVKEMVAAKQWTEKTHQENTASYKLFIQFAGKGIAIDDISSEVIRDYKALLQNMPKYKSNSRRVDNVTDENHHLRLFSLHGQLGTGTINRHLTRIGAVLAYAVRNGYITHNPASGMKITESRKDEDMRGAFTAEELRKLFKSKEYVTNGFQYPYQFWTPILALFTGARQNEIAQLYLEDLRQEDGIWVMDINGKHDKKLKTKTAARLIPLHPFVIELGLPNFVKLLSSRGESRLFPELTRKRDGYGTDVSHWFNGNRAYPGYRRRCGINPDPNEPKKDFHSFRHTFIDHLVAQRVDLTLLHLLNGHKTGSMTLDRYSKRHSLVHAMFSEVIEHIQFHHTIPLKSLRFRC